MTPTNMHAPCDGYGLVSPCSNPGMDTEIMPPSAWHKVQVEALQVRTAAGGDLSKSVFDQY